MSGYAVARRLGLGASSFYFLLSIFSVSANDSTASLGAGGLTLTQSADIRMASEDLSISRETVRVRYSFVNESGAPITTRVAFPLPEADMEILADSDVGWPAEDADNVVDFQVTVDGRKVKTALERKAFLKGVDVTDVLLRLGAPISPRAHDVAAAVTGLPKKAKDELARRGLINLSENWAQPLWTVKNTYHWQQTFPADRPLKVEHTYKPITGGSMIPAYAFFENPAAFRDGEWFKSVCVDQPTYNAISARLKALQKKKGQGAIVLAWTVDYVLTTGRNWKGPIGTFKLTVDKGRKDNVISFCMDGVRKTGPTTFVVERTNFEPEKDLSVLIVEAPRD
jgi:hypothetical protein